MSLRRLPRAIVPAALAISLLTQLLAAPVLAREPSHEPSQEPSPAVESPTPPADASPALHSASPSASPGDVPPDDAAGATVRERLRALKEVRAGRPDGLRGVLAAIASDSGFSRAGGADVAGLVTRRNAAGTTLVAVTIRTHPALVDAILGRLERLGVEIANRTDTAVEAYLSPAVLELVAVLPGVEAVEPVMPTVLHGLVGPGVRLHAADSWHSAGYLGSGVKVGIIDGGFAGIAAALGDELPATVHARCYSGVGAFSASLAVCEAEGIDHGTGVAETVADMAPGASLYIANPLSLQDYQRTVSWMTSNGVKVINASLATAYQGPGDGSDPTGASLYTVVAQATAAGVLWVNAAGNSGQDGWLGRWSDPDADDFLNFSGSDQENGIQLWAGQQVIVTARWNDVWGKSRNDYDIGVFDPSGALIASSVDTQNGDDDPVETLVFEAGTSGEYAIIATRHGGASVSRFQILVLTNGESSLEHRVLADTIPSPVDSRASGLLTVGAVDVTAPATIQPYSSRGPTLDNRIKPDLVAGDCGSTASMGTFCGTSQSAPHVAGAAALVFDAFPSYTAQQVAAYLRTHAVPLGGSAPNNIFGAGRLDLGTPPGAPTPAGLVFQAQPGGGVEGAPLRTQPVVRVVDASGATVASGPGASLAVSLALAEALSGATLECTGGSTVAAVAGVATFSGCRVDRAGEGYSLVATAEAVASATSNPFAVTTAPVTVVFATQPADGPVGQPLPVQPVVHLRDGAGRLLANGASSNLPVTLAIGANSASASLECTGGTTVTAVGGVAAFSGCTITAPGSGFTLVATAGGAGTSVSAPFSVSDPTGAIPLPTLALTASQSAIRWGTSVRLDALLTSASSVAVSGRAIRLQSTVDGSAWSNIGEPVTTDGAGRASFTYRPVTNHHYRAVLASAADLAAGTSTAVRVTVRQLGALRPGNGGRTKAVPRRTQVAFQTTVRPSRPDVPAGDVTLQLYRLVGSRWTLDSTQVATPDAAGVATIVVTFAAPGKWYVRTQVNPTPVNANSGWSPIERYDVR